MDLKLEGGRVHLKGSAWRYWMYNRLVREAVVRWAVADNGGAGDGEKHAIRNRQDGG